MTQYSLPKQVNPMFEEHDVVIANDPGIPVAAGSQGTIVHVHHADPLKYLVEFPGAVDSNGRDANGEQTLGVYPMHAADLKGGDNSWKDVRKRR
jgi:hypothetical protein